MKLAQNLKKARSTAKLTQLDLAIKCDVTPATISNIERQATRPDIVTLMKIAEVLKVSVDFLLGSKKRS